jgi:hypothetical protein
VNFLLLDRICNWASIEGYHGKPRSPAFFGDRFSHWAYDLGRREGAWLRIHEKKVLA